MIQVLQEERRPNKAEKFGNAFNGIVEALSQYANMANQKEQQAMVDQKLSKLMGMDVSGFTPEMKQKAFEYYSQGENQRKLEAEKLRGKEQLQDKKMQQLFGELGASDEQLEQVKQPQQKPRGILSDEFIEQEQTPTNSKRKGIDTSNLSDEQILRTGIVDQGVGRIAQHAKDVNLREKGRQQEFNYKQKQNIKKEVRESYKDNEPFINKTYDQYEDSLRKESIIERMNQLNDSEEMSDSGVVNALEALGLKSEWLKNPANEEYNKLGLDLLGGGSLQADYGSRVLASEFMVSQQRVPTLSQTKEGRRQIAENIQAMLLPAKLKKERMQYYLDKAERTGEPLPHDLRGKIMRDIQPQLDTAYDKFKQRNGRYKVSQGTSPDDNAIKKYYYISNGDPAKAKKMMIEDGYDIK